MHTYIHSPKKLPALILHLWITPSDCFIASKGLCSASYTGPHQRSGLQETWDNVPSVSKRTVTPDRESVPSPCPLHRARVTSHNPTDSRYKDTSRQQHAAWAFGLTDLCSSAGAGTWRGFNKITSRLCFLHSHPQTSSQLLRRLWRHQKGGRPCFGLVIAYLHAPRWCAAWCQGGCEQHISVLQEPCSGRDRDSCLQALPFPESWISSELDSPHLPLDIIRYLF